MYEKSRRPFQDIPLLPQDFILIAKPFQFSGDIGIRPTSGIAHLAIQLPTHPSRQRRKAYTKIVCDLPLRPTARSHKAHRLRLERIRKLSLFRHRGHLSWEGNSPLYRGKSIEHRAHKGLNNRAENSHVPLRKR
jgi:hypothetical protein